MAMLKCTRCKEWKDPSEFGRDARCVLRNGQTSSCRDCVNLKTRSLNDKLRASGVCIECGAENLTTKLRCSTCTENLNKYGEAHRKFLRMKAFDAYGGAVCACCGENRIEFLTIDHIDGGGYQHRKQIGVGAGTAFCRWLKNNNYPRGYRVLCSNCNSSLGRFDYCPHQHEYKEDWNTDFGIAV